VFCECAQQGVDGSLSGVPREFSCGSLMTTEGFSVQYALDTRGVGESRRVEALRVKQMSLAQECPLHVEMLLETIVKRAAYFGTRVRCTATVFPPVVAASAWFRRRPNTNNDYESTVIVYNDINDIAWHTVERIHCSKLAYREHRSHRRVVVANRRLKRILRWAVLVSRTNIVCVHSQQTKMMKSRFV
jgi:hypothetical protein